MSVTDTITFPDYITFISLGISAVSIILVIYFQSRLKKLTVQGKNVEPSEDSRYEVSAIVSEFGSRLKRLEEGLVDLKVRQEILDLRVARSSAFRPDAKPTPRSENSYVPEVSTSRSLQADSSEFVSRVPPSNKLTQEMSTEKKQLGGTELEALRIVFEGHGRISAKEIQQKIDRTREHTARMMSSLYHEGLVERDVTARPFSYSITQKGRDLLNS